MIYGWDRKLVDEPDRMNELPIAALSSILLNSIKLNEAAAFIFYHEIQAIDSRHWIIALNWMKLIEPRAPTKTTQQMKLNSINWI